MRTVGAQHPACTAGGASVLKTVQILRICRKCTGTFPTRTTRIVERWSKSAASKRTVVFTYHVPVRTLSAIQIPRTKFNTSHSWSAQRSVATNHPSHTQTFVHPWKAIPYPLSQSYSSKPFDASSARFGNECFRAGLPSVWSALV